MSLFSTLFRQFAAPSLNRIHGESGTYTRVGSDRAVEPSPVVIVTHSGNVDTNEKTKDDLEQIWLMVDAAFEVRHLDQYVRPESVDSDQRPFVCTGRRRYGAGSHVIWEFTRTKRLSQGMKGKA